MKFFIILSVLAILCVVLDAIDSEGSKSKGKVEKVKEKIKHIKTKVNDKIADGIRHYLKIDEDDAKKGNHKVDSETQLSAGETEILLRLRKNNMQSYHIDQYGNVNSLPSKQQSHDEASYNPSGNSGHGFQPNLSPYAGGPYSGSQSFKYNQYGQPMMEQSNGYQMPTMLDRPNMPGMSNLPASVNYQGGNQFMGNQYSSVPNSQQMVNGRLPSTFSFGNGFFDDGDMNPCCTDAQSGYSMTSENQFNSGNMNPHGMGPSGMHMGNSHNMNSQMDNQRMKPPGMPMENSNYVNNGEMVDQRMRPSERPMDRMKPSRMPVDNSNYVNNGEMVDQRMRPSERPMDGMKPSGMPTENSNYVNNGEMNMNVFNGNMRPGMGPMGNGDDSGSDMGRRIASNSRRFQNPNDRMQGTRVTIRLDDRDQQM